MRAGELSPFIFAYETRYEECRDDASYVDDYLGLLQAAGWSGRYNRVFTDFEARFPDQRNRLALPHSAYVAPGS